MSRTPPQPTPTRFSIASCTTPTASISPATACDDRAPAKPRRSEWPCSHHPILCGTSQQAASRSLATALFEGALAERLASNTPSCGRRAVLLGFAPAIDRFKTEWHKSSASKATDPGRHHLGIPGDIKSERWARPSRNARATSSECWRLQIGPASGTFPKHSAGPI